MRVLLLCTEEDCAAEGSYLARFSRLQSMTGVTIKKSSVAVLNPVTLDALCDRNQIDAVMCTQPQCVEAVLRDTKDYNPPKNKKKFSLDEFAGSLLKLRSGREFLVLNGLERLRTVPEERYVVDRFVSKITKKSRWFPQTEFKWGMVTESNKEEVLQKIIASSIVGIDIENPYPQYELRPITCTSYTTYDPATHTTESWVVPFLEVWHWEFMVAANDSPGRKVLQNGLHDNSYFMRWGAPVRNWVFDTFHLFHSWQAELPRSLDFLAAFFLRNVRYWKDDGKTGNLVDLYRYNALDGWGTVNTLLAMLSEYPDFATRNYVDHEFPMVFPCLNAGMEGLECDRERFDQLRAKKQRHVEELLADIRYLLSTPGYNPGSWQQNAKVFQLLGCDPAKGTGKIPTLHAKAKHPLNNYLLTKIEDYKKEAKQVGTYFDPDKLWHGRVYYGINPGGTDTLRAASKESSFDCGWQIQNTPRDDQSFKECLLAPAGWYLAEADKKQSEARCVGYLSGDLNLINLVESPHDYHAWNASQFFGIPYEEIYDEEKGKTLRKDIRDLSKRTNHGANYNMGPDVMLDTMGPLAVAKAKIMLKLPKGLTLKGTCEYLLNRYKMTYPSVKGRWYESIILAIETTGKLVSPMGWTRVFHSKPRDSKPALNSAVAHPPQNLSVSIVNKEWYKIWRLTIYGELRGKIRIKAQIHDSLLFIYRKVEDAYRVAELMDFRVNVVGSDRVTRSMLIPSDLSIGKEPTRRWSDLK